MSLDDRLAPHDPDYDPPDAYKAYTAEELDWWVRLLTKRAGMRVPGGKRDKDVRDAANYRAMREELYGP